MISIDLNKEEARGLLELLEADLSDLRMEIADTDALSYRDGLRAKKLVVQRVIERLQKETGLTGAQPSADLHTTV